MHKFGFVFPGQGSQKQGMLSAMAEHYPQVQETFAEASATLGFDLGQIVQDNPDDQLNQTAITQPALLAASVALWRIWHADQGPLPELLAGHSLGEYSALVCAGVLDFADAVDIVHKRGLYMQEAVPSGTGSMAAIIGLDEAKIEEVCQQVAAGQVVAPANFNAPGQIVIAGDADAVARAVEGCKQAGAKRALPLNVSVPSHCALMQPAARRLAEVLATIEFNKPEIPIVQNINGRLSRTPDDIRDNLLKQLHMPVQWVDTIGCMKDFGIGKIVECGPGKVLNGLIRRIDPDISCYSIEDKSSLDAANQAIRE